MSALHESIERLIQKLKHDPGYRVDPVLSTGDLIELLWARGVALWRGLWLRCRVGSADGLLFVARGVRVRHTGHLHLGRNVTLEEHVQIDALSRDGVRLGDNVSVGRFTVIEATGVITRLGVGFSIGANSNLGDFCFVGAAGGVRIGENVLIGQRVSFHSENHVATRVDIPMKAQGVTNQGVVVEDDCWLGSGAILLDGVTVGRGSIVAAGSVVTRDVAPYSVVGGVPAHLLRSRLPQSEVQDA